MRILHVLSATFFAGSVSYAVHLANAHQAQGHAVWLASDAAALPTAATCVLLPVSDRRYAQRLRNIRALRRLVRAEQIDVVHAHSRAASWVAYFALRGLKVPLVSTVHGRQHLHASTSLFDIYGDKVIAICANLREHLVAEVKMEPAKIVLLPNGVDFSMSNEQSAVSNEQLAMSNEQSAVNNEQSAVNNEQLAMSNEQLTTGNNQLLTAHCSLLIAKNLRLAFIGRFNGGKGERAAELLQHVFPPLLNEFPTLRLALVGGELDQLPAPGKTALAALHRQFGERIEVVGFTEDVPGWLGRSTLVIGAGRVAIEALGAGVPVLALGEALYAGRVMAATYEAAAASNFGDISALLQPTAFDPAAVLADARAALAAPESVPPALAARVRRDYDLARVAAGVLDVYQAARMKKWAPAWLPVLMYHKIPDQPLQTKHRIFVTKVNFERHLRFFRRRGFTALTFRDYLAFARGERPLAEFPTRPLILTFDDGYRDNYANALPLMEQYGFRGVLYLLGDPKIDHNYWDLATDPAEPRGELMTPAQQRAFVAAGWEIGAHTLTHADLTTLPPAEAAREMTASKAYLERTLHTEVVTFAYPYGRLTPALQAVARVAGFALAVATSTGPAHLEDDRFRIYRVNVFPEDTPANLWKKTSAWYRAYRQLKVKN